ncbi:Transcription factor spt20 [Recurvomyces mirabilis]|nr:Transcription factor spt20 [Recurvomyces mirabilis]
MATAAVSRPTQALRQRRSEVPRLSLGKRTTTAMDGEAQQPAKRRKLEEPYVRNNDFILRKHRGKQPSLVVHLHDGYWKFGGQEGSYGYDDRMKFVLQHIRHHTVPHEMMEDMLAMGVSWYDGCLIVEVHNHKTAGGKQNSRARGQQEGGEKFSMHRYNEHITPSAFAPYPKKARTDEDGDEKEADEQEQKDKDKGKGKDEPKIYTTVLHPTELSRHHEMLLLAATPASELRSNKKKGSTDGSSSAVPATPLLSVPPTPINTTHGPLSGNQKMALEEGDLYSFQGDLLVATEAPLFLEPVKNPQDAQRVLDMLSHPLHQEKPPSPKTRKRTTAQMAADDAQAAEAERRMLIMDERIKPSARSGAGAAAESNQSTAASLGFSRFKTLEMVRQKHEENERIKKEEEARAALEKKQLDEQNQARQQVQLAQQEQRKQQVLLQQQAMAVQGNNTIQQRQALLRAQQMEQQRQAQAAAMTNQHTNQTNAQAAAILQAQQANFQQQQQNAAMQGSPIPRQPTPSGLINSSPMMPQNGFPMVPTSSQGAGSPPRPTTGAQNRGAQMARQVSQQHGSQHNTPQIPQGTPSMGQAMPSRQMSQTPRLPPGSPAVNMQGTPISAGGLGMNMPTPQMSQTNAQFTPEQMMILQQQQRNLQQQQQQQANQMAGSPGMVNGANGMTPHDMQAIQQRQNQQRQFALLHAQHQQAQAQGVPMNPQLQQQYLKLRAMAQHQQQQTQMRAAQQQQQQMQLQMQMANQQGNANSIHGTPTPQMGHPQTPQQQHAMQNGGGGSNGVNNDLSALQAQQNMQIAQQRANAIATQRLASQQQHQAAQANMHVRSLTQQYNGLHNVPSQVVENLPGPVQQLLRQQLSRQHQVRQHQQNMAAQRMGSEGNESHVPAGTPNPQYMQQLRANQAMLQHQMSVQQQQQQQGGGGFQGQQHGGGNLDQHFSAMQNALARGNGGGQ